MKKLIIKKSMPEWLKRYYQKINNGIDTSEAKDKVFWKKHPKATTVETHVEHKNYNVTPKNETELKKVSDALKGKISHVQLNDAGGVIAVVSPTPNLIPKYDHVTVYEEKSWIKRIMKKILEWLKSL